MITVQKLQKSNDLKDLFALSKQFFEEYELHHDEFFKIDELHEKNIAEYFNRFISTDNATAFGAFEESHVVGYITLYIQLQAEYWQIKQVGCISGLMVHKDFRRRGIGKSLLIEAIHYFEEKGIPYLTVYTAASNQAAIEFYARNGMTPLYTTMVYKVGDQVRDKSTK
jgi:ribosomal protein S18 acetylase RimI-like enzyme